MGWNRHYCSCTILYKNEIRHINWYLFTIHRIYCKKASKETCLFSHLAISVFEFFKGFFIRDKLFCKRVNRSNTDKGCTEKGILSCCKNSYVLIKADNTEINFDTFTPAYPVLLHCDNPFRPSFQFIATLQKVICIISDF